MGISKKILLPAVRQYRHNTGGEEFVFAYEEERTEAIIHKLLTTTVFLTILGVGVGYVLGVVVGCVWVTLT